MRQIGCHICIGFRACYPALMAVFADPMRACAGAKWTIGVDRPPFMRDAAMDQAMVKIAVAAKIVDDFQSDLSRFHIGDLPAAILGRAQLRDPLRVRSFGR